MLKSLFRPRTAPRIGDRLYENAVAQARRPNFYARLGVEDRIDARFELYTLHVLLLILRLRDEPGQAGPEAAQDLFDTYVSALDNALRELGVGDISMARKMRNLGEALYGRMTTYEAPLRDGDPAVLTQALARNVYADEASEQAETLATYTLEARRTLSTQSLEQIVQSPVWPEIAS